jgi:hypothetical protein
MNVAEILLNIQNEYNGHKQTIIRGLTVEDGHQILDALSDITGGSLFSLRMYDREEFSIYQEDYWKRGEHPLGHTSRLILSNSD